MRGDAAMQRCSEIVVSTIIILEKWKLRSPNIWQQQHQHQPQSMRRKVFRKINVALCADTQNNCTERLFNNESKNERKRMKEYPYIINFITFIKRGLLWINYIAILILKIFPISLIRIHDTMFNAGVIMCFVGVFLLFRKSIANINW